MIKQLIWTIWTPLSSVLKTADKLNLSLSHQKSWHLLCKIGSSLLSTKEETNYLCHLSVVEWYKMQVDIMLSENNATCQGLMKYMPYYQIHYNDVIMSVMVSQITSLYSTVYSRTDQRKHESSMSLAFVWRIHRWLVNSLHKGPVMRKMFPFDDVIMIAQIWYTQGMACRQ